MIRETFRNVRSLSAERKAATRKRSESKAQKKEIVNAYDKNGEGT